jgi:hypothetical protein
MGVVGSKGRMCGIYFRSEFSSYGKGFAACLLFSPVEIDASVTNDICHCRAKIHHKESLVTN